MSHAWKRTAAAAKWVAAAAAIALPQGPAQAQISDNVVKIGVLTDLSGPASDAPH